MSKREIIIAIILFCVFIIWTKQRMDKKAMMNNQVKVATNTTEKSTQNGVPNTMDESFDLKKLITVVELNVKGVENIEDHDPFLRLDASGQIQAGREMGLVDLKLAGIFAEGNEYIALINDEILKVGDFVLGYEITKISQNEVVIVKNMKVYKIQLYSEEEGYTDE